MTIIWVGIGGIFGAIFRYLLGKWITATYKVMFPLGTWIINITGSFFLGVVSVFSINHFIAEWLWLLVGVGFLGAYTTFSTFGYETIQLMEKKQWIKAFLYVISSVILGILFAWTGTITGEIWLSL